VSKYQEHDSNVLRDQETLLAALQACGYGPDRVEVHAQPQALYGYENDRRAEAAHVIIRRYKTGILYSNDLGFLRLPDGRFRAIVSDYDNDELRIRNGQPYSPYQSGSGDFAVPKFLSAVEAAYGKMIGDAGLFRILTEQIPGLKAAGLVAPNATARVDQIDGGREVHLVW
jgi:hypothetical protein